MYSRLLRNQSVTFSKMNVTIWLRKCHDLVALREKNVTYRLRKCHDLVALTRSIFLCINHFQRAITIIFSISYNLYIL